MYIAHMCGLAVTGGVGGQSVTRVPGVRCISLGGHVTHTRGVRTIITKGSCHFVKGVMSHNRLVQLTSVIRLILTAG